MVLTATYCGTRLVRNWGGVSNWNAKMCQRICWKIRPWWC